MLYVKLNYIRTTLLAKGTGETVNAKLRYNIAAAFGGEGEWSRDLDVSNLVVGNSYTLTNTNAPYVDIGHVATVFVVACFFETNASVNVYTSPSASMSRVDIENAILRYYP